MLPTFVSLSVSSFVWGIVHARHGAYTTADDLGNIPFILHAAAQASHAEAGNRQSPHAWQPGNYKSE